MAEHVVIFVTTGSMEEAERIASELLNRKLVACANLLPGVTSLFWWQGELDRADEVLVVMKTRAERLDEVTALVNELHSYDVCEVIALPIVGGSKAYLDWVDESVG